MDPKPLTFREMTSAATVMLAQYLSEREQGEVVTYGALCEAAGTDVTKDKRNILMSARRIVEREYGKVFGVAVRGQSLKCLTDSEITRLPDACARTVKRKARRVKKSLGCIQDLSSLSAEDRMRLNVGAMQLNVLELMASTKSRKRLEEKSSGDLKGAVSDVLKLL